VLDWIKANKALLAAVIFAAALAVQGNWEAAVATVLAALSGGVKPVPLPTEAGK
jgi:hypothetical protein